MKVGDLVTVNNKLWVEKYHGTLGIIISLPEKLDSNYDFVMWSFYGDQIYNIRTYEVIVIS